MTLDPDARDPAMLMGSTQRTNRSRSARRLVKKT
jgi:hypothetical protein